MLPYDSTGLRTTKTVTWEALDKVLIANAAPDHLPRPDWADKLEEINADRERKGLPPAIGRRNAITGTDNYTEVRW